MKLEIGENDKKEIIEFDELSLSGFVTPFVSEHCFNEGIDGLYSDLVRARLVDKVREIFIKANYDPYSLISFENFPEINMITIACRNKKVDEMVQEIINYDSQRTIINLGCGFDTRFFRLNGYEGIYYDVDKNNVAEAKTILLDSIPIPKTITGDYCIYGCNSIFDKSFLSHASDWCKNKNPIVICEGVFLFYNYSNVIRFVKRLFRIFPKATFICDEYLFSPHKELLSNGGISFYNKRKPKAMSGIAIIDSHDAIREERIEFKGEIIYPNYYLAAYKKKQDVTAFFI